MVRLFNPQPLSRVSRKGPFKEVLLVKSGQSKSFVSKIFVKKYLMFSVLLSSTLE